MRSNVCTHLFPNSMATIFLNWVLARITNCWISLRKIDRLIRFKELVWIHRPGGPGNKTSRTLLYWILIYYQHFRKSNLIVLTWSIPGTYWSSTALRPASYWSMTDSKMLFCRISLGIFQRLFHRPCETFRRSFESAIVSWNLALQLSRRSQRRNMGFSTKPIYKIITPRDCG